MAAETTTTTTSDDLFSELASNAKMVDLPWSGDVISAFVTAALQTNAYDISRRLEAHIKENIYKLSNTAYQCVGSLVEITRISFNRLDIFPLRTKIAAAKLAIYKGAHYATFAVGILGGVAHSGAMRTNGGVRFNWKSVMPAVRISGHLALKLVQDGRIFVAFKCSDIVIPPEAAAFTTAQISVDTSMAGYVSAFLWNAFTSTATLLGITNLVFPVIVATFKARILKCLCVADKEYEIDVCPVVVSKMDPTHWFLELAFWMGLDQMLMKKMKQKTSWLRDLNSPDTKDDAIGKLIVMQMPFAEFIHSKGSTIAVQSDEITISAVKGYVEPLSKHLVLEVGFSWAPSGHVRIKIHRKGKGAGHAHLTIKKIRLEGRILVRADPAITFMDPAPPKDAPPFMTMKFLELIISEPSVKSSDALVTLCGGVPHKMMATKIEAFKKKYLGVEIALSLPPSNN